MQHRIRIPREAALSDLLGTYMQVPAHFSPPAYAIRSVAGAFDRWAEMQSVNRLAQALDVAMDGDGSSAPGDSDTTPPA